MTLVSGLRPWPGPLAPFWWAARALKKELLGFRFEYPLEAVHGAGAKDSLHYYVYSESLFFDAMELDSHGIPVQRSRIFGETYNPAYVAWYGLMSLARYLRALDPDGREAFLTQVAWLVAHHVRRGDGSVVWPYTFDWREGDCSLQAPWISAMAQGLALSALVRAYRLTGEQHLLELCASASEVFKKDVEAGGVRTLERGHVLYEEYPGDPPPRVLDGFLFSLLGLYDLFLQTGDPATRQLFDDGIDGLRQTLPFWDYRCRWSWYGPHAYLCPPHYHKLNGALLASLARLSGDSTLERCAQAWDPGRLTLGRRAEVFLTFVFTKNRSRLKHLSRR